MTKPRAFTAEFSIETDRRRQLNVGPSIEYRRASLGGGSELSLGMEFSYRPSSRVELEVEPEWSTSTNGAQYVRTTSALPYEPTYGARYLFADLDRRELALETRLNVTFSPTLSFQLYAQPLLSSGHYTTYKQLAAPESFDFNSFAPGSFVDGPQGPGCSNGQTCVDPSGTRYVDFDGDGLSDTSFGDRDFNVRSLIGNAVLRWEYRPGSTVFFVWQRTQEDEVRLGNFDLSRDVDALLSAPAENTFIIKVNYWLGR